jgi:hypothetical protein
MPRVGKSLILIENSSLIKIKAYSVVDRFCADGSDQKKCPQSFRTAGKSTKSGGDTWLEARVALRV